MSKNSCEKCGKEFNSKSHYNQHQKRKTPCVNDITPLQISNIPLCSPIENTFIVTPNQQNFPNYSELFT